MRRSISSVLLALTLVTTAATPALARRAKPPAAETRGDVIARRTEQARAVVTKHFTALAAADAKAVRAQWTRDAQVISVDGTGRSKKQSFSTALTRWLAHTDGLQWKILSTNVISDTEIEINATVSWNGTVFDDALRVVTKGNRMLIRHKWSRPHASAETRAPSSGY